jgi:hypothetical protein
MPVYAQMKWDEKTSTFLVIFHFDDDFSKPNLRTSPMLFGTKPESKRINQIIYQRDRPGSYKEPGFQYTKRTVLTWAPSHTETALLSDLLQWANIINGFKSPVKLELRKYLEIFILNKNGEKEHENCFVDTTNLRKKLVSKKCFLVLEKDI